ncbi:MAG: hypothetical protein DRO13_02845 [Thermoprotei archaeon]|nr:MAG: hypothetical protein DRO13_02845 [Thermoprotei archaeon]
MSRYTDLTIYVKPKANTTYLRVEGEELVFYTTEPPVGGRANESLIKYLSKKLKVPRRNVVIVRGVRDRVKVVRIYELNKDDVMKALIKRL